MFLLPRMPDVGKYGCETLWSTDDKADRIRARVHEEPGNRSAAGGPVGSRPGFDEALDALHNGDTSTPMGSMVFTAMAPLAEMEFAIKRERITDSVSKRRAAGKDLGGRRPPFTDSQIQNARRLINAGEPATQVAKDLAMSRATLYRRMSKPGA